MYYYFNFTRFEIVYNKKLGEEGRNVANIWNMWEKVNISIGKLKRVNKESYVSCNWQRHLIRLIGNLFISGSCYHFQYLRFVGVVCYNLSQIHCVNKKHFTTSEGSKIVWLWFSSFCEQHVVNINYSKISKLGQIK